MLPIIYRASDVGAPTLDGNKGSLITVLKDCLVNGFPARSCTIERIGSVATVTLTAHGFVEPTTVLIENAVETEYNGSFSITVVDANTFTYTVSGTPSSPATGSITAKIGGAGWTVALEDAPNFKIIFRNYYDGGTGANGSGRYFRVQDNGRVTADTSSFYLNMDRPAQAAICGMRNYSDINTPVIPFPRVIAGGDLHNSQAYGVTARKTYGLANVSNPRPYIIIADNRVCYIMTNPSDAVVSKVMPISVDATYEIKNRGIYGFGDIKQINPSNTTTAQAFIFGGVMGSDGLDVYNSGTDVGNYKALNIEQINTDTTVYLDISLENSSKSVQGALHIQNPIRASGRLGGDCVATTTIDNYVKYPTPYDFDVSIEPIFVCEKLDDPIRAYQSSQRFTRYSFGTLPGLNASLNTTQTATGYAVANSLTVVTSTNTSKKYFLYSTMNYQPTIAGGNSPSSQLLAFDLGDWWV